MDAPRLSRKGEGGANWWPAVNMGGLLHSFGWKSAASSGTWDKGERLRREWVNGVVWGGGCCLDSQSDRQHIFAQFGKSSRQCGSYTDIKIGNFTDISVWFLILYEKCKGMVVNWHYGKYFLYFLVKRWPLFCVFVFLSHFLQKKNFFSKNLDCSPSFPPLLYKGKRGEGILLGWLFP